MSIHIENLNVFSFVGYQSCDEKKPLRLTNCWLKKFETKQEDFDFACFGGKEEIFVPFHALPSTQWIQSKDEAVLDTTLRVLGNKHLALQKSWEILGSLSLALFLFMELCPMGSMLLTKWWTCGNCSWKSVCCLPRLEGNLPHCRIS